MDIKRLIVRANQLLQEARYTQSRIYSYNWLWKKGIVPFMLKKGLTDFDKQVGEACILTFHEGGEQSCHHRDLTKSVDILIHVLEDDSIGGRMRTPIQYPLNGEIGKAAEAYIASLSEKDLNPKTINNYKRILSNFSQHLLSMGKQNFGQLSESVIIDYVEKRKHRQIEYVRILRLFLLFLQHEGAIQNNFSTMLGQMAKASRRVRVPSFYEERELSQLEQSMERKSKVGKRNYAIVLICSRLGLRISDVASLCFDNLDWEMCEIRLIQHKTGTPLTLPLLPEVGNAIIDYLRNARPNSASERIFLSCRAPYGEMTSGSVHNAIGKAFCESGIHIGKRHHGGHALRFSLAQRMLEKAVPIKTISETLGHTSMDTTRDYVKIDLASLRRCTLDVPPVDESFYLQRGGWFYD